MKRITAIDWVKMHIKSEDLYETYALGLNKRAKKSFDDTDAIDNLHQISFEDPEVERICHEHGVYTCDDAASVTSIKDWFKDSAIESFNELKLFTGLKKIEDSAFYCCISLQDINIPSNVTSIGYTAFYYCKSLKSITIPDSVKIIRDWAFYKCPELTISISKKSPVYKKVESLKYYFSIKDIKIVDSVNESSEEVKSKTSKEPSITNSQGQDVPEVGRHAENVYLTDCPFMIGKDQVDWFEYFQREKEKHTIKDVDGFIASARKDTELIKR